MMGFQHNKNKPNHLRRDAELERIVKRVFLSEPIHPYMKAFSDFVGLTGITHVGSMPILVDHEREVDTNGNFRSP